MPRQSLSSDQKTVSLNVLIPESLKRKLERAAVKDYRSLSQEVRYLLELALDIHEKEQNQEDK